METTGRLGLEKIQADALAAVSELRQAITGHANKLDTAGLFTHGDGPPAAAAGVVDRYYHNDLTGDIYRDDGTDWNLIIPGGALAGTSGAPADGNRFVTELDPRISGLAGSSNVVFVATVGDGAASEFAVDHNLGTRSIEVQVRQSGSPFAVVEPDIELTTLNRVTVRFGTTVPAVGEYTVTVMAPGTAIQTVFPAGILMPWAGAGAPAGWLLCDGTSYLRADFPALFAALGGAGSPYGLPDATHFQVPDLRDRVPVGASGTIARGATGGEKTHTLTDDEMPVHDHIVQVAGNNSFTNGTPPDSGYHTDWAVNASIGFYGTNTQIVPAVAMGKALASGGDDPHNNMQPYVGVNYLVKT